MVNVEFDFQNFGVLSLSFPTVRCTGAYSHVKRRGNAIPDPGAGSRLRDIDTSSLTVGPLPSLRALAKTHEPRRI
jgi:hypothetical protein